MKTVKTALLCLFFFILGCGITFYLVFGTIAPSQLMDRIPKADKTENSAAVKKAEEIQSYIDTYFVGEYDESALADGVGEGMIAATGDRWSSYVPASQLASYNERMSNSYQGIGVTIQMQDDGTILITDVTRDGPAYSAGIMVGDEVFSVDGSSVEGLSVTEVRDLVRNSENDAVVLEVVRNSEKITFSILRTVIETEVASYEMLDGNIAYISILNFDSRCADETIGCIEQAMSDGAESLLFDVRFNPGGYKDELVRILDYLLPEGVLFRMKDYSGKEDIDESDAACVSLPMAVLINEDSYSAAEFFAAALQEYGAAKVVGAQTCGKGYFQYFFPLSDGSGINLSSGTYYTPNDVSLIGTGIIPDFPVDISDEEYLELYYGTLAPEDDLQLQSAVEYLKNE